MHAVEEYMYCIVQKTLENGPEMLLTLFPLHVTAVNREEIKMVLKTVEKPYKLDMKLKQDSPLIAFRNYLLL